MSIASIVQAMNLAGVGGMGDWWQTQSLPDATKTNWWENATKATKVNPTYQGLMGGDWDAYQRSLQAPGEAAARQSWQDSTKALERSATGNGMYGSSQYTRQMVDRASTPYMNALTQNAAQAAAQRYQAQNQDNQFAANYGLQAGGMNNQVDAYNNNLLKAGSDEEWRRWQANQAQRSDIWNRLMQYADATDQYKDSQNALSVSRSSKANTSDSGMGGLLGGIGSLAGGLLGMGGLGDMFGGLFGGGGGDSGMVNSFGDNYANSSPVWSSWPYMPNGLR